jgi:hypothetical protein
VRERCAAIDVDKQELAIALITGQTDEEGKMQTRIVGTTVPALEALKVWLIRREWVPAKLGDGRQNRKPYHPPREGMRTICDDFTGFGPRPN